MKAALIGEFHVPFPELDENGNEHIRKVNVPWTVIKKIHKAMIAAVPALAPEDDYVGMLEEANATLKQERNELRAALARIEMLSGQAMMRDDPDRAEARAILAKYKEKE